MEITLVNLLTFAGTTGIVTALLNQGIGWLREWRASSQNNRANAGYLALRLAVLLEAYADTCSQIAGDIEGHSSSGGHVGNLTNELPEVPPYPEDEDSWRAIAPDLSERCLSFPNKVRASQRVVYSVFVWGDEDDMAFSCLEECAARGLEAWALAGDLRKRYRIPPHSPVYDYAKNLEEMARAAVERRKKENEQDIILGDLLDAPDIPNASKAPI